MSLHPLPHPNHGLGIPTMSDSSPPVSRSVSSGRKGSRKVRTGCITCKVRKVKCGEEKPHCVRCLKSGRRCDGYLDPGIMASRRKTQSKDRAAASPYSAFSALLEWAQPEEKRSLHFFQQVTAPHLAGDLDAIFWKVLVLQVCQTEPAVRHAVLAVSSFHESLTLGGTHRAQGGALAPRLDAASSSSSTLYPSFSGSSGAANASSSRPGSSGSSNSFALQQYNKAIACLLSQMRDTTAKPLAPLLTCVLFVCLEFMNGKDNESLLHLEQGRKILSKLGRRAASKDPEIDIIKRHLVPIYLRLSVSFFFIGAKPTAVPQSLKTLQDLPAMFESVQEIRFALYDFMDEALRFRQEARMARFGSNVPPETFARLAAERDRLLRRLARFNVAFSLYQAGKPTHMTESSSAVCQMYLHMVQIWVSTALSSSEAAFDEHLPSFASIIPLAATILNSETASSPSREFRPKGQLPAPAPNSGARTSIDDDRHRRSMFTFETYVIPVLYFVATKCRHPLIRHSALDLLKQNPHRRENLWKAKQMAAIAEHVIKVEEDSAPTPPQSDAAVLGPSRPPSSTAGHEALYPVHQTQSMPPPDYPPEYLSRQDGASSAYPDLVPSIESATIASEFMPPPPTYAADSDFKHSQQTQQHRHHPHQQQQQQQQQQHHMDLDLLEMEGGTLLGLEDLDLEMVHPGLTVGAGAANHHGRAASYTSGDDHPMASQPGDGGVDMHLNTLLAPSPYPHMPSASPSRASSIASPNPDNTYLSNDWRGPSSSSGSENSLSPASEHGVITVAGPDSSPAVEVGLGIHDPHQQQMHHQHQQQQQLHYAQSHHQQHQQPQTQHHHHHHQRRREAQQYQLPHPPPRQCSMEAPFDIPENIRVHDVLIGPEKDDGSWLTVFRKLRGPAEDWSVYKQYIMA